VKLQKEFETATEAPSAPKLKNKLCLLCVLGASVAISQNNFDLAGFAS
jgi:hypothetical protein